MVGNVTLYVLCGILLPHRVRAWFFLRTLYVLDEMLSKRFGTTMLLEKFWRDDLKSELCRNSISFGQGPSRLEIASELTKEPVPIVSPVQPLFVGWKPP